MRLNITDIPEDGIQQEFDLLIAINDSQEPDVAQVFAKILKIGKKVLIEGSVKISVSLSCSRCLKDFPYPLDITFREEYNPAEERETEGEKELTGRELDLSFYSNDEIDITGLIKEQVLLSVPMKPLCGPECRGICPACGKALNEGPCECRTEEVDPRLAPLKKFRESMKNRKE
jgi:uncharacterized protein